MRHDIDVCIFAEPNPPHGYYEWSMTSLAHTPPLAAHPLQLQEEWSRLEPANLLARLRSRDQAALAQITRSYGPALTRAAYLHLGDGHAAEDAAQEALIAAWDGAHRTGEQTALWPWLLGIVFNRCRKHLRSLTRRRRREQHAHALRLAEQGTTGKVCLPQEDERAFALRQALLELPEILRCVVILRYEQALSVTETAAALGIPEGTVKRRCHDAIVQLRQHMRATL